MKPIREYLQELPSPYNALALSVVDESYESYKAEVNSLLSAIMRMCIWEKTPQGYGFWDKVYLHFRNPNDHQLPPIPVEQVEKPKYLKSTHPDEKGLIVKWLSHVSHNRFEAVVIQQGSSIYEVGLKETDWNLRYFEPCDYTPAVEVSPEVEQPKTEMESCLDKKLSDNPTIADSIGSHFQLAFEYSEQLVNENTSLRAQLYRLPILEQENAQLKAPLTPTGRLYVQKLEQENRELRADKERIVDLLNKAQITIADLESQLLSNPKELVYDAEWLQNILQSNFGSQYNYSGNGIVAIIPNGFDEHFCLGPKVSAGIIMAALAKELNDGENVKGQFEVIVCTPKDYEIRVHQTSTTYHGAPRFAPNTAQKAIGILTQIAPQVLKNYFA